MVGFRESMSTNIGDIYIEPNRKSFKNDLKSLKKNSSLRPVNYFATNVNSHQCVVCKDRHPLYSCHKFKAFTHDQKLSTVREHHLCMNCLSGDHFFKGCASYHRCKQCQKRHHTLLHTDLLWNQPSSHNQETTTSSVTSNAATGLKMETLMMTCRVLVLVRGPGGGYMEARARALLDSASSSLYSIWPYISPYFSSSHQVGPEPFTFSFIFIILVLITASLLASSLRFVDSIPTMKLPE